MSLERATMWVRRRRSNVAPTTLKEQNEFRTRRCGAGLSPARPGGAGAESSRRLLRQRL